VLDENCSPITGAIVDVWQADDGGAYDNTTANFNYRGRYQTGSDGMYEFTAVKPGWYLNGSQYRPSHIHFRVTKPAYKEVITQLYFKDDPYIAADPWASDPDAEKRIVPISNVGGVNTAMFDITLEGPPVGIKEMEHASPVAITPNPFTGEINLTSASTIKSLEVFDATGLLVARTYGVDNTSLSMNMGYLGCGLYFCRIETASGIYVHKLIKQ
jgi:hypothetical protein